MFHAHVMLFPSPDLELAISLRNLVPFIGKQYLETSIWALWVLVNTGHKHFILTIICTTYKV